MLNCSISGNKNTMRIRLPYGINIGMVLSVIFLVTAHVSVRAQGHGTPPKVSCVLQQSSNSTSYQNIAIPYNASNGTEVSDWFTLASHSWGCSIHKGVAYPGTSFSFISKATPSGNSLGSNATYKINNQLGYKVQWRAVVTPTAPSSSTFKVCAFSFASITSSANQEASKTLCTINSSIIDALNGIISANITIEFRAKIVKIGNLSPGASGNVSFSLSNVKLRDNYSGSSSAQVTYTVTGPPTCTVSAHPSFINLGSVTSPQLPQNGSGTNPQGFGFNLSCTPGIGTVKYRLEDYPTGTNPSNNVLKNTASWPATGVGIQIRNASGNGSVNFNQDINLPGWNSSTGGTYSVGLSARILRTSATTQPGGLSSQMVLKVKYQ